MLVDEAVRSAAAEAVDSGWWSMGPRVQELESAFRDLVGSRHALAVANGTAALHLALLAAGIGPGDEVVLPSLNFVAAANVVRHVGAEPVFCDVGGPDDLNMDPVDVERALGPRTRAILALHYGGVPCRIAELADLARERGVVLLEDAAHAPGAGREGAMCGTVGAVGCFSFFSNKNLPVGEGGMVVTDDDGLAERLRLLRSHGMTTLTWDRHRGHAPSYDVLEPGLNYRLDELRAAIGLVMLGRLRAENEARGRIAGWYRSALSDLPLEFPLRAAPGDTAAHHLAVTLLPAGTDREQVRAALAESGVQTSVHYPPIHRFTAYAADGRARPLPRTEEVAPRLLTLPLFGHMTGEQKTTVADALRDAVA